MERQPSSVEAFTSELRTLGVRSGDLLMLHASMRAVGPVTGGADGLLDALETAIGPAGALIMVLGARNDWDWVNERPEADRADLLRDAEPFDHLTTPAEADVGIVAEVLRTRARTVVSDHPEGRFAASGAMAHELVDDVPWDDYYGPGSSLERLVRAGGRVLRLGADLDTVTVIHYAEYLAPVASKRRVRRHRVVLAPAGQELRTVDCLDDSNGIVDVEGEDYFAVMLREYLALGRARTGTVGAATAELIEASDIVDFAVAWMAAHLDD